MQLDINPWKIYRNNNLASSVTDYATAGRVLKALQRAFPNDKIEARYQGKAISHFHNGRDS